MNRIIATAILAFTALVVLPAQPAMAKKKPKTQIKFATLAPEGSTWMKVMHEFDDELRAQTENRVGFKFYPGGVQGDEEVVLRKMRLGQVHAGGFTGFGLGAVASEFRAIEIPFLFRDLEEVDYVREELDPLIRKTYEEKGFTFLGWADVGFVYLFSNQPIRNPDELRAAKVWTWSGDKLAAIFFEAFNVSPIPLALPDVLTSLQMGVVDAVYSPPLACIALQWFTRVKYMTDVPITYGFGAMLISNRMLKKLEPQDVAVLKELANKHAQVLIDKTRAQNAEAIELIQKEGVEILAVAPDVTAEFFATGRTAWDDGVGDLYPQELLDRVKAEVEKYRGAPKEARQ
jgi:TRAP-type C4-dicarboxylate transport system substrate-binding protein